MPGFRVRASLVAAVLAAGTWACIGDPIELGTADSGSHGSGGSSSSNTNGSGSGSGTNGSGDGDGGETGGQTGGPCNISLTTEVPECPEVVGEGFCSDGGGHVDQGTEIEWSHNPPHSGNHYPTWETWGEHEEVVPRGNWVHNMEHGGIVLAYNCPEACDAELDVLRDVIAERPDLRILMTPDPELDPPRFAAVSWTWVYEFDEPDLAELLCFADQHFNHAPEDVP